MPGILEETTSCQLFKYSGTTSIEAVMPTGLLLIDTNGTQVTTYSYHRKAILEELRDLYGEARSENWDGEDGTPLSPVAHEWARKFLMSVPLHIPAPELSIDRDGHVNFDWVSEKNRVAVAIDERGLLYFFALVDGNRIRGMIKDFSRFFPTRLLDELRPLLAI